MAKNDPCPVCGEDRSRNDTALSSARAEIERLLAHLASLQRKGETTAESAGWKLVPVEMTKAMEAAHCAECERILASGNAPTLIKTWRAVLAASPAPVEARGGAIQGEAQTDKDALALALEAALSRGVGRTVTREEIAREICHYSTGPSDFNSCCPEPMGKKRCERKADRILALLQPASITDEMIGKATSIMMARVNGIATDDAYEIARMMLEAAAK